MSSREGSVNDRRGDFGLFFYFMLLLNGHTVSDWRGTKGVGLVYLCYFLATKSNQKLLGYSPSGQILKRHKAAPNLQATKAPDNRRIKKYSPADLMFAFSAWLINPKPWIYLLMPKPKMLYNVSQSQTLMKISLILSSPKMIIRLLDSTRLRKNNK